MRFILAALFLLSFATCADARPGRGASGGAAPSCPGSVPSGQDDGCASANKSAQFINTAFFSNARQSGQSAYAATPAWNVAGVTYPVGQITPDAGLIDFASSPPSGWSNTGNSTYRNDSVATVSGYWINDVGLFKAGGSLTLTNNHITMGKNTCRQFSGTAQINVQSSTAGIDAENNTWDTDSTCSWRAEQYGTAYDPGLTQQFSGNITIASNTMTINSGGTGFLSIRQFLNWSGIAQQVRIVANVSPGGISDCTGSACNGTTWTVCQLVIAANSGACNSTVTDVGPIAATTGPIQPIANAAIRLAASNGTTNYILKYNAILKYSTMAASAGGGLNDHRFNYFEITGKTSDHDNFVANLLDTNVTTSAQYYQKFNTIVWDYNTPNTGTTILGTFLTSNNSNSSTGAQITWDPWDVSFNTVISNSTTYPSSGGVTAAAWRTLQQGTNIATMANAGTSISGSVLTITTVSTGTIAVGDFVECTGCTGSIQIASFGTGSGGAGTYNLTTTPTPVPSGTSWRTRRYPGAIVNMIGIGNYFDITGSGVAFLLDGQSRVTSQDFTSVPNINMVSGSACTPASCP